MALIPWKNKQKGEPRSEVSPLVTLRSEMDRLFDSFLRDPWAAVEWPFSGARSWSPAVDLDESEDEVTVRVEIPGMDPKELDIALVGNQLVLSGEKRESRERKDHGFAQRETRFGSFRRAIPVPNSVDPEKVEAQYANGVVTIHLKKTQKTPSKRIEIKST